jgi:O-antigen/teichoic acid export membrane protein
MEDLFKILFLEQWIEAANYVQLMCFIAFLTPLHAMNTNVLKVLGKSDLVFYIGLIKKVIGVTVFYYSLTFNDIYYVLYGQILSSAISYIPNSYYMVRMLNYGVYEQMRDYLPSLGLVVLIAASLYPVINKFEFNEYLNLTVNSISILLLYYYAARFLKLESLHTFKQIFTVK